MILYCQYILKYEPLILNPEAATLHLTIFIYLLIHPSHPSSACLILLLHHSIRLLNTILTSVINNRLVIPLSINIPPSLLGVSEALQFLSPLEAWFTPLLTACPGLFSPHCLLSSLNLCCVSFFPPLLCLHVNLTNISVSLLSAHSLQKHPIFTHVLK